MKRSEIKRIGLRGVRRMFRGGFATAEAAEFAKRLATRCAGAFAGIFAVSVAVVLAGCAPGGPGGPDGPAAGAGPGSGAAPGSASGAAEGFAAQPLRYDLEYPAVGYSTRPLTGRVARLDQQLASGELTLERDERFGLLPALLDALDIDMASQTLVFSATSFQVRSITPRTPRAIYFNDDTYVAMLHGSDMLEIASMDPELGPVFHTIGLAPASSNGDGRAPPASAARIDTAPPRFERQMERCLRCHDSLTMSGGGVPRLMLGSGYIGPRGNLVSHEGWILTTQRTPLRSRWGGWYVTGRHGEQVHLGNLIVHDVATLAADLDSLRIGNLDALPAQVDRAAYPVDTSDIVALMVLQHQTDVQNLITRVGWDARGALARQAAGDRPLAEPADEPANELAGIDEIVEPLVHAMLFAGEARLTDRITGSNDFGARFQARGPHDSQGRTLRALDLQTRLLRYPLSWLIYSEAFDALPEVAKTAVTARIGEVLRGEDTSEAFAHLDAATRAAIGEILLETRPDLAAALARDGV
jgi:hypothetical protein